MNAYQFLNPTCCAWQDLPEATSMDQAETELRSLLIDGTLGKASGTVRTELRELSANNDETSRWDFVVDLP